MSAELSITEDEVIAIRGVIADNVPIALACRECDVTWRDIPSAPCWFCGASGHVINPARLVLD